jgi:release factor glutamine methyltransferase
MFVQSNSLKELFSYFKSELSERYGVREVEQMFYWTCEDKLRKSKYEVKSSDIRLSESELLTFNRVIKRLKKGEPFQYVLGEVEFYNAKIIVAPGVLIPRPETEELVDLICKQTNQFQKIVDIGTGSGCIAVALKKANPLIDVVAVDVSDEAITSAKKSAKLNNVDLTFIQADILTNDLAALNTVDCIVSNLPYVLEADKKQMSENVLAHEPHLALFVPDNDPLLFYKRISELGTQILINKGHLYFEIHEDFGRQTKELLDGLGYQFVEVFKDMQGKDRMVKAIWLK